MIKFKDYVINKFKPLADSIMRHEYTHYWLHGGRGSTKSSFVSLIIVLLVVHNPSANVVILRRTSKSLRNTIYAQMKWAISTLGYAAYFKAGLSPLEYVYMPTGQKIIFMGEENPEKLKDKVKDIKFDIGYAAICWFEELDQFSGEEEIRNLLNSIRRGGDLFWIFYTYNPPKVMWSWVNRAALAREQRADTLVHQSTYLDVAASHPEWIGQPFIDDAEILKLENPKAYEWEYLGHITGSGGSVFENIVQREITDAEIQTFDNPRNGVDFGWFPDPWAYVRSEFQPNHRRVILYEERYANKTLPSDTGEIIRAALTFKDKPEDSEAHYHHEAVYCDESDNTAIAQYRRIGLNARPAAKGNMRKNSYYWLAGLREIVIDPKRCPKALEELLLCEFKKDRYGEYMDDFNDGNDHFIDAMRYAYMDDVIRSR
jgi:PBSX family phage terminase large subunit